MPRKKSGLFDQDTYVRQYIQENRTTKNLTFNKRSDDDMELLKWINDQPESFNQYVKRLIRKDMEKSKEV